MRKFTLCIVNHNGRSHLADTLPGVQSVAKFADEVLLLDNASSDGSQEMFLSLMPRGRVVQLAENRSPGNARSAGFRAARSDFVLFADNDIRLTPEAVLELVRALVESPQAVIAMPRVVLTERPGRIQYEGAFCHWLGHMILRNEDAMLRRADQPPQNVDSMISACFMVVRSRWKDAVFFDPGYEFYYEDHDVGVRARLSGAHILAVPHATVLHGSGTPDLSLRPGGAYSSRRIRTLIEGRWRHLLKNLSARGFAILLPALLAYEIAQLAGVIAKGWFPHWWQALRATVRALPEIRIARRRIQSSRRLPDRELLRGGPLPFKPELIRGRLGSMALATMNSLSAAYWNVARRLL
jgi:GT2 family glycosyltransferase